MSRRHKKILRAVEDRFYDDGLLSSAQDIADGTDLSVNQVRDVLPELEGTALIPVYKGKGKPTVYATKQMKNALVAQGGEPEWIAGYQFQDKVDVREEIKEQQEKISRYQRIEGLLYATGGSLEKSVEAALIELGFDPVATEDEEDFIIRADGKIFVIEVKGKSGEITKKDVAQLGTWLDKWIDKEDPDKLRGVLLANSHRHKPPEDRDSPLSAKAEKFLRLRPAFHVTTYELFELVKQVWENQISKDDAAREFLSGDPGA